MSRWLALVVLAALVSACSSSAKMTGPEIQGALKDLSAVGTGVDADSVDGKSAADFATAAHVHQGDEVVSQVASAAQSDHATTAGIADEAASVPWSGVTGAPDFPALYSAVGHIHAGSEITGKVAASFTADSVPWSGIAGAPSSFTPSQHGHAASDVTSGVLAADRIPGTHVVDANGLDLGIPVSVSGGQMGSEATVLLLEHPLGAGMPGVLVWRSARSGAMVWDIALGGLNCGVQFESLDCTGQPVVDRGATRGLGCPSAWPGGTVHLLAAPVGAVTRTVTIRSTFQGFPNPTCLPWTPPISMAVVDAVDYGVIQPLPGPLGFAFR